jgi:Protein of unknown function (DUF3810)
MWWRASLVVLAVLLGVTPMARPAVERYYSSRFFPAIQHSVTELSNRVPFALFDVLLIGAALWWVAAVVLDIAGRRSFPRVFFRLVLRTLTLAAVAYIAFVAMWGFNYRRLPLTSKIKFDERAITSAASRELVGRAADELNRLYVDAHSELALTGGGPGRRL